MPLNQAAFDQALSEQIGSDTPAGQTRERFEALSPFGQAVVKVFFQCGMHPRHAVQPLASGKEFYLGLLDHKTLINNHNLQALASFLEAENAQIEYFSVADGRLVLLTRTGKGT
ncbi:hypothetical protein [Deinococcus roseus]|uniref:Uncharacterized protein n=1 Tax=Deinococcus roseus TaxID=392414 RepID=A0ABQ2DI52_9DEIO|nr:hypothetical protein [Deinococcus roseus]GGJ56437.1 hypothetical protein GCM10008938_48240 [Deinococcus roseus]